MQDAVAWWAEILFDYVPLTERPDQHFFTVSFLV